MDHLGEDMQYNARRDALKNQHRAYLESLFERALTEMAGAQIRFPQPNYVTLKVAEEGGEVVRAAVHYAEGRTDWEDVEDEVIQNIAMNMRLLIEGDQKNGIVPPTS